MVGGLRNHLYNLAFKILISIQRPILAKSSLSAFWPRFRWPRFRCPLFIYNYFKGKGLSFSFSQFSYVIASMKWNKEKGLFRMHTRNQSTYIVTFFMNYVGNFIKVYILPGGRTIRKTEVKHRISPGN